MISVALAQPNGAFTLGIWSVAFAVSHLWSKRSDGYWSGKRTAIILCFIACAAWVLLFVAPPLQGVVTYSWKSTLSIPKAIVAGLLFMFANREGVQPFLTVLVLLGVAKTLKDRRLRWLSVSYIAAFSFYVIDVATDGFVKQLNRLLVYRLLPHRCHDCLVCHSACCAWFRVVREARHRLAWENAFWTPGI